MTAPAAYMHGTSPMEQGRLARLNDLLNESCLRELALRPGDRVLDFGSGLGQLTRLMGRQVGPPGWVLGVELSGEQLERCHALGREEAPQPWVEFRQGDVNHPPLTGSEPGSFDVAFARFVIEHVTDPPAVVRAMVSCVRPGGRIVLMDDDHDVLRFWPEPEGFAALWAAYIRYIHCNLNDPFVGRRLVTLLHQAGARPERTTMVYFGGCAGSVALETMVENVVGLFDGIRERMLALSQISAADYEAAIRNFRSWGSRPDAGFWYSVPWAEGRRPGS